MFLSEYLELNDELSDLGVFDTIINRDSHFFINLIRLRKAKTPEFSHSYEKINKYFENIMMLLKASEEKGDKLYNAALKKFDFSEVNGINLGFSETGAGAGFGRGLSKQIISDAYDIVKSGSSQPEIFQLVGLFEENVAADRLSDMIATLILEDIYAYTLRINSELGITADRYKKIEFLDGFVINPFKGCKILYLPEEILHELPIAKSWHDIDKVISENRVIRNEINQSIGETWRKLACREQKKYIKEYIFKDTERCARVISGYCAEEIGSFSKCSDLEYYILNVFKNLKKTGLLDILIHSSELYKDSLAIANQVLIVFKDWVENNKGWEPILMAPSNQREKVVQKLIQLSGKHLCDEHDYDFTFEPNEGPGPADIKISHGAKDKTVIEVKLNSNKNYLHGYEEQIQTYMKAESTTKGIYVYVKVENHPMRDMKMMEMYSKQKEVDNNAPRLFVVDSQEQISASKR